MRYDHTVAVPAGAPRSDRAGCEAKKIFVACAGIAITTSDPGIDDPSVTRRYAFRIRPKCQNFTHNFVSHGEGQLQSPVFKRDPLTLTEVEMPFPNMQITVTHTATGHA